MPVNKKNSLTPMEAKLTLVSAQAGYGKATGSNADEYAETAGKSLSLSK
jgi:hypothetical protein